MVCVVIFQKATTLRQLTGVIQGRSMVDSSVYRFCTSSIYLLTQLFHLFLIFRQSVVAYSCSKPLTSKFGIIIYNSLSGYTTARNNLSRSDIEAVNIKRIYSFY